MPTWPTALGGMLFASYAATQAQKVGIDSPTSLVASAIKTLGSDVGYSAAPSTRSSGSSELTVLQGEVDRLHKLLSDVVRGQKGGGHTVIHTGRGAGGWSVLVLPAAVAGGVFYVYIKVRGISVSDFFMVTNKSLQQFRDLVSNSMTQLWEELRKQKDELLSKITGVGEQQQQMMAQQNQMDEKLRNVSANVEDIRDTSNDIQSRVGQMDHTINLMNSGVQRANEGIYLLCAAVSEVTRRVGMDQTTNRLKSYVQASPPELTEANPGLRHLLSNSYSSDQTGVLNSGGSGIIVEVPEDTELTTVPDATSPSVHVPRVSGNKSGLDDMKVLYRRDSAPALAARAGIMGGLFGVGSNIGNRKGSIVGGH